MNAALPVNGTFGLSFKKDTVAGVPTEQYRFNSTNPRCVRVYSFNKAVNGGNNRFEIVSTDIGDGVIEEEARPGNNFAMLYRNDGRGNGSTNTGFLTSPRCTRPAFLLITNPNN